MSARDEIAALFTATLGPLPPAQLEIALAGGVIAVDTRSRGTTAQTRADFRRLPGPSYYLVGCLSLCRVTVDGYAAFLMENSGVFGFTHSTAVTNCKTADSIRAAVTAIGPFTSGFRHPLNLPELIYRVEDIDAAYSAAEAYRLNS